MKKCSKCSVEKPLSEFHKSNESHRSDCKSCVKKRQQSRNNERTTKDTVCTACGILKEASQFNSSKVKSNGLSSDCRPCASERVKRHKKSKPFDYLKAKKRQECNAKGILFDLTSEYLESIYTGRCAITNEPLILLNDGGPVNNSASLDRFDPDGGYVNGNVSFIAHRLNMLKSNGTSKELRSIADWMDRRLTKDNEL